MNNQPATGGEAYDPAYKIAEIRDYLEERYTRLFTPGQQLSLDETLIRAFGRIKFKVRIVTKAARYGIKIYMITDAVTAFVLLVLIYTGRSTYGAVEDQEERLKTVQVVNHLVQPFVGTYRTIYVDRFYTSLELLKSLEEKKTLYNWDNAGESNSTGNPDRKDIPCLPPNFKRRCNQKQS
jgi:Transposase IS4